MRVSGSNNDIKVYDVCFFDGGGKTVSWKVIRKEELSGGCGGGGGGDTVSGGVNLKGNL